ncbi:MAG: hypothetical protein [Hatfieldvirus porci]|uniref:Uncharacterized protein n=1 Tax=phage Lak_Megaphage_RVC_JS4_GC31 TaxID=3109228 RepID=A0ABZ0Z1D1_9CAUD|nr:MAG: hypothetical protein [phage Lak_Megaphage_RVC_JS4_GC31]
MKREVRQLIENFSDLFDDPEIFSDEDDSMLNNKEAMKLYKNDLDRVLLSLIETDCPKAWKKGKDKEGDDIIYCQPKQFMYGMSAYIQKVVDKLKLKGWKTYKIGIEYALSYSTGLTIYQLYKKYYNTEPNEYRVAQYRKQQDEFVEQLRDMPDFVNKLFKDGNGTYKQIMVSPDNGIIFTFQTGHGSLQYYQAGNSAWRDESLRWQRAVIKLTGEFLYDEIDNKEAQKKRVFFKDIEKRKSFLSSRINKSVGKTVEIKEIVITPTGLPMGITYFDWKEWLVTSKAYKKYSYPVMVKKLVEKGYVVLSKFEKEDPNSMYECEKDGLSFKLYKDIDCSKANSLNFIQKREWDYTLKKWVPRKTFKLDSCIICELEGYNLDHFEEIFNTYKKDDQS